MVIVSRYSNKLVIAAVAAVLSGCGANEIASPGSGGNISIVNNTTTAPVTPPVTTSTLVTPAGGCPTIDDSAGLADRGTITGPTGTYRVCELPARFTRSSTLTKISGLLYSLGGRVDVGYDRGAAPTADAVVTLTINPGVVIYATTGVAWLAVNRGNRISAVGTATSPIVFTSRDNVLGLATDDSQGQWGGVVLLGRAPVTDCTVAPAATPGTVACERQTEGAVDPAYFGGATPADNSGTMKYVQIRYSGYVLSADSELQALTLEGVGTGTSISYIHSHNSSDDAMEAFGGRVNMKYMVFTGADDDNLDLDTGYQGNIQYVIAVQKTSGAPDSMIELDSANALENQTPRTYMKLSNFTFVHKQLANNNQAAILLRGGADSTIMNGIMTTPSGCLRLNGTNIIGAAASIPEKIGPPVYKSVAMSCGATPFIGSGGLTAQQVTDNFNAGTNVTSTFTSTLSSVFINGANETARTPFDAKTIDAFFDTTTYVGAVKDATDTWYAGWTCNSKTATFSATGSACTSLPAL